MAIDGLAARPWLLLPGTLCTTAVFNGLLDRLGVADARRFSVDLNRPSIKDYRDLCLQASRDTVVCGFSLGAIVAAHLADQMAAHRIVLFGINPYADDPAKAQGRNDLARDVTTLGGATAMRMRLPELHGPAPDHAQASILNMADETAGMIGAQTQLALNRPGALPALSRSGSPVFVLTGSKDTAAPPAQGRAAAGAAPNGRFGMLDQLGHYALVEDPQVCAQAVLRLEDDLNATR